MWRSIKWFFRVLWLTMVKAFEILLLVAVVVFPLLGIVALNERLLKLLEFGEIEGLMFSLGFTTALGCMWGRFIHNILRTSPTIMLTVPMSDVEEWSKAKKQRG